MKKNKLGQHTEYKSSYDPRLISPLLRQDNRKKLGMKKIPFTGVDVWCAYEISCLDPEGKPLVTAGIFTFSADSKYFIESKSFKLYLNSFNNHKVLNLDHLKKIIIRDFKDILKTDVKIKFTKLIPVHYFEPSSGNLDKLKLKYVNTDMLNPDHLKCSSQKVVSEMLYTSLFRSNCPVTNQPDWADIFIEYTGEKIDYEGMLRYLLSFRNHNDFHEDCVETIYRDIMHNLHPKKLTVYAQYTRRGGIDINPFRSNCRKLKTFVRRWRQ